MSHPASFSDAEQVGAYQRTHGAPGDPFTAMSLAEIKRRNPDL